MQHLFRTWQAKDTLQKTDQDGQMSWIDGRTLLAPFWDLLGQFMVLRINAKELCYAGHWCLIYHYRTKSVEKVDRTLLTKDST